VHVGIEEAQPAVDLGARARTAIAAKLGSRIRVGEIVEDGNILGQHPVALLQHRHRARRVEREKVRGLGRSIVQRDHVKRGPAQRSAMWSASEHAPGMV